MMLPRWLSSTLRTIEKGAAYAQGKGYGSGTVRHEVALVATLLNAPPTLAVDIGGHWGTYSRELKAKFVGIDIHVFEPATRNLAKLRERYGSDHRVTINPCAISDRNGDSVLFSERPGSGLASLHRRKLDHYGMAFDVEEAVRTVRFGDYWRDALASRTIDIVKMDIEGHEFAALQAFDGALAATKVVQFEFGGTNIDSRTYFQDFYYLFGDAGFDLYRITPLGLERIDRYREADEFFFTINYLAANRRFMAAAG